MKSKDGSQCYGSSEHLMSDAAEQLNWMRQAAPGGFILALAASPPHPRSSRPIIPGGSPQAHRTHGPRSFFQKGFDAVGGFASGTVSSVLRAAGPARASTGTWRTATGGIHESRARASRTCSARTPRLRSPAWDTWTNRRFRAASRRSHREGSRQPAFHLSSIDKGRRGRSFDKNLPCCGLPGRIGGAGRAGPRSRTIWYQHHRPRLCDPSAHISARRGRGPRISKARSRAGAAPTCPLTLRYMKNGPGMRSQYGDLVVTVGTAVGLYPPGRHHRPRSRASWRPDYETSLDTRRGARFWTSTGLRVRVRGIPRRSDGGSRGVSRRSLVASVDRDRAGPCSSRHGFRRIAVFSG
ncbi:MAG: hypothetical protein MZU97_12015 [Bacillus subtilis]|nr:hypothetical protein [Bacillus subtilis]